MSLTSEFGSVSCALICFSFSSSRGIKNIVSSRLVPLKSLFFITVPSPRDDRVWYVTEFENVGEILIKVPNILQLVVSRISGNSLVLRYSQEQRCRFP